MSQKDKHKGPRGRGLIARLKQALGQGNPLLRREVLTTMRMRSVKVGLVALPLALLVVVLLVAADTSRSTISSTTAGATLLGIAVTAALYVVGLVGAVLGAQSIAGERQGGTLELIRVTGMSPWRIVIGKAAAVWVVMAAMILACLPPLSACFLVGGVSLAQLAVAVAVPLAIASVPVSFGICLGTIQRSSRLAAGAAVVVVGLLGPLLFSAAWMSMLLVLDLDLVRTHGPFVLPTWDEGLGVLLTGGLLLPLAYIIIPTWFFLALSVSALRGEATDKVGPLRWWFAVTGPATALLAGLIVLVRNVGSDERALIMVGLLGAVLFVGLIVLSAHPRPRRVRARWFNGPSADGALAVGICGASIAITMAFMAGTVGNEAIWGGLSLFAFLVLIAGVGVLLSTLPCRPRMARGLQFVVGGVFAFMPLGALLFEEIFYGPGAGHDLADMTKMFSPVTVLSDLADVRTTTALDAALPSVVVWTLLGAAAWAMGAFRMRRRRQRAAASVSPARIS